MMIFEIFFCVGFGIALVCCICAWFSYLKWRKTRKKIQASSLSSFVYGAMRPSEDGCSASKTTLLTDYALSLDEELKQSWGKDDAVERKSNILSGYPLERDENFVCGRCRAKRRDNGEWVIGFCPDGERDWIFTREHGVHGHLLGVEVDADTVSAYTGWKLNGKEIFVGDCLVKHTEGFRDFSGVVSPCFSNFFHGFEIFSSSGKGWNSRDALESEHMYQDGPHFKPCTLKCSYELLGNIFDNPEYSERFLSKEGEAE